MNKGNSLNGLYTVMREMINIAEQEFIDFTKSVSTKSFKKGSFLTEAGKRADEIFFINNGIIRVLLVDQAGVEHTVHFALENQFIADYAQFILHQNSIYSLQALEETEVVVLDRDTIEWGYQNLKEGQKMGRLVAEFYFIYQDNRIKNTYVRSPKERYDNITSIFPNIHNRVPQHMIASYLGITPIHLSRLKKG